MIATIGRRNMQKRVAVVGNRLVRVKWSLLRVWWRNIDPVFRMLYCLCFSKNRISESCVYSNVAVMNTIVSALITESWSVLILLIYVVCA
jgi:hypothetical protein